MDRATSHGDNEWLMTCGNSPVPTRSVPTAALLNVPSGNTRKTYTTPAPVYVIKTKQLPPGAV